MDGKEKDQRLCCGIAVKYHDVYPDLHRPRRHVANGQHDGGCECRSSGGQRRVWIGERHAGIVCTFEQSLLSRHVVDRGRFGPVDMELRRFSWWHRGELLRAVVGVDVWWTWIDVWIWVDVVVWVWVNVVWIWVNVVVWVWVVVHPG